jgi:Fe-S cluster assembly protein SufD
VGQLDETAVFYLRSRGVSERQARRMLTYAFAGEILGRIEPSNLRAYLDQRVSELFSSTGQATI